MRKSLILTLMATMILCSTQAQKVSTFESLELNPNTYWDGASATLGLFQSELEAGGAFFNNQYSRNDWGYGITEAWSGFAYSKVTDNTTPGYSNQYSCVAGKGANASDNYGVFYVGFGPETIRFSTPKTIQNLTVCNATYPYFSMRDGDSFSKKFGGDTGDDPDFFILHIVGMNDGQVTDTIDFYLADFRSENNNDDYFIDDWTGVDLRTLGEVDAISFSLSSSDVGDWGMNTPGYFCIDNLDTVDFESLGFTSGEFWNGATAALGSYGSIFSDGAAQFNNSYTLSDWGYGLSGFWTGWAYSSSTDNTTPGYGNSFGAIPGSGVNNSETYALCYNNRQQDTISLESAYRASGLFVTNGTYPYLSMRDGDSFAKKFGGENGNDPDYFILQIIGLLDGFVSDTIDFYLADFRFEDNSLDYIIDDWSWIDLNSLGLIDQLVFSLKSSDMGDWGMNTPAYFFIDDLSFDFNQGISLSEKISSLKIYPNPVSDRITISSDDMIDGISILSINGQLIQTITGFNAGYQHKLDLSNLRPGHYLVKVESGSVAEIRKIIKL
ncbi:MAG: DUF4465 domain-containing protein [Bacteroidetes bacterium]|nr:DUF4465 domain-containing protein [Bacteroidota bacterium]MBT4408404.1 DUF4465 domain-containing protein [Bacteroidota bacterium]MBT5425014.1 DUF4465 domain-containing protein [Bacteroidota bacterium]